MTLKEACKVVFQDAITPATLKAEASRGNLVIRKIGRTYFVTWRDLNAMWENCSVAAKASSDPQTTSSSESLARARATAAMLRLKNSFKRDEKVVGLRARRHAKLHLPAFTEFKVSVLFFKTAG